MWDRTGIGSPGRRLLAQRPDRVSLGSARHSPCARRRSGRLHSPVGNQGRRPSCYRVAHLRCTRSEFNPHARQPPRGIEEEDGRAGPRIRRRPIAPPGWVRRLNAQRVPQMGWNALNETRGDLYDASRLSTAYFANSFVCEPIDTSTVTAWSTHDGDRFAASVASGHIVGVQFHPEKSSAAGVAFIHAFLDRARP